MTVGDVIMFACQTPRQSDDRLTLAEHIRLGKLAIRAAAADSVHLESDEVTTIKNRVATSAMSPVVLARVVDILDPPAASDAAE